MAIILFQGMPAFLAVANSINNMLGMRIGLRVNGAMSSMVFKKAQRLPLCADDSEEEHKRAIAITFSVN